MKARDQGGFTLIELLVAISLSLIVFGATLNALDIFQKDNRDDQLRNETQDNARNAVDLFARQLRSVSAPSTGAAGALQVAEPFSIVFQTSDPSKSTPSGQNASNAMRVRYCLDDSNPGSETLWTQVHKWETAKEPILPNATACPDLSQGDWETSRRLAQHVTNEIGGQRRSLFSYPASSVGEIASVEVNMFTDLNPGRHPGETQLTTGIGLRNANRAPIAEFTATNVNGSGYVRLNASESIDPDGLALTYKWWKDGALQETTSQAWETASKESPGEHTYKLEVKDPGGLSSNREKTVKA
jgi:prepilin-type N-terminal cleavage/methylation domain-containing protein